MGEVIQFPVRQRRSTDHYFGGCPFCGGMDGIVDVGPLSWCVCHQRNVRRCIGPKFPNNSNGWIHKVRRLTPFRDVMPIFTEND